MRYYNYINEQILEEKFLDIFSVLDDIYKKNWGVKSFLCSSNRANKENVRNLYSIFEK